MSSSKEVEIQDLQEQLAAVTKERDEILVFNRRAASQCSHLMTVLDERDEQLTTITKERDAAVALTIWWQKTHADDCAALLEKNRAWQEQFATITKERDAAMQRLRDAVVASGIDRVVGAVIQALQEQLAAVTKERDAWKRGNDVFHAAHNGSVKRAERAEYELRALRERTEALAARWASIDDRDSDASLVKACARELREALGAPATEPPHGDAPTQQRDESKPPPGWRWHETESEAWQHDRARRCRRLGWCRQLESRIEVLPEEAWRIYDSEHGYAPKGGPAPDLPAGWRRFDESTWYGAIELQAPHRQIDITSEMLIIDGGNTRIARRQHAPLSVLRALLAQPAPAKDTEHG